MKLAIHISKFMMQSDCHFRLWGDEKMYTKEEMLNYVDSLAAGVDPLTGEILTSDTVLNRPDVIRMLYSVKDFINSVEIKESKKVKNKKTSFELKTFDGIIDDDSTISDFVYRINEANADENMKKFNYKAIVKWLIEEEYLELLEDGKKTPTKKGEQIGLHKENRINMYGRTYEVILYNSNAQEFILNNISNGNIL